MSDANVPPVYDLNVHDNPSSSQFTFGDDPIPTPEPFTPGVVPVSDAALSTLWFEQFPGDNTNPIDVVDGTVLLQNGEIVNAFSSNFQFLNQTDLSVIDLNNTNILISNIYWNANGRQDIGFIGLHRESLDSPLFIMLSHPGLGTQPLVFAPGASFTEISSISILNNNLIINGIGIDGLSYVVIINLNHPTNLNLAHQIQDGSYRSMFTSGQQFATFPITHNGQEYYATISYTGETVGEQMASLMFILQDSNFQFIRSEDNLWNQVSNENINSSIGGIFGFDINSDGNLTFNLLRADGESQYTSESLPYHVSFEPDATATPIVTEAPPLSTPSSTEPPPEPTLTAAPTLTPIFEPTVEATTAPTPEFNYDNPVFPTNIDDANLIWNHFFNIEPSDLQFNDITAINNPGNQFDTEIDFNANDQVYTGVFNINGVVGNGYIAFHRDPTTSHEFVLINHSSLPNGARLIDARASYSRIDNIYISAGQEILILGKGIGTGEDSSYLSVLTFDTDTVEPYTLPLGEGLSDNLSAMGIEHNGAQYFVVVFSEGVSPAENIRYHILDSRGSYLTSNSVGIPYSGTTEQLNFKGFRIESSGTPGNPYNLIFNFSLGGEDIIPTVIQLGDYLSVFVPPQPTPLPTEPPEVREEAPTCQSQIDSMMWNMPRGLFENYPDVMAAGMYENFNDTARVNMFDDTIDLVRDVFHHRDHLSNGYYSIRFNIGIQEGDTTLRSGFRVLILKNRGGVSFGMEFIPENPDDDTFQPDDSWTADDIIAYLTQVATFGTHLRSITIGGSLGSNLQFIGQADRPDGDYQVGIARNQAGRVFIYNGFNETMSYVYNPTNDGGGLSITLTNIDDPEDYIGTQTGVLTELSNATVVECQ
ncbi:MAG: hypothetical protein ABI721_02990 [Candidatus Dojkabacteria bacterium]